VGSNEGKLIANHVISTNGTLLDIALEILPYKGKS